MPMDQARDTTTLEPDMAGSPVPMRNVPDETGPAGTVTGPTLAGTIHTGSTESGAVTRNPIEASQGIKLGRMRWVLGVSLLLVIVAMAVITFVVR
jgi:hypothetical protein